MSKPNDKGKDKRKHTREINKTNVRFSVVGFVTQRGDMPDHNIKAKITDISKSGIGLTTSIPLEPGHLIKFNTEEFPSVGIVVWSMKSDNDIKIGVKFI